ncbi:MAG: hypothetical protein J1F31_05905 [Erysipelotrichales bacterium]|nr:hypothetical protein [Erysipelotrichales bacterium]
MDSLVNLSDKFFDNLIMKVKKSVEETESDKLCLQRSLQNFLKSGRKEDAFSVYFCFSEIFNLFGNGYENTKRLLELLSDHEYHSGELLSKHRDHYSHSVYVFTLGLAIYSNDSKYRKEFNKFYNLKNSEYDFYEFLKLWGLVALFHDIGYPFQLAHEQIKTYSEELLGKDNPNNPYVTYNNLDAFLTIKDETKKKISKSLLIEKEFSDLNELLAYGLKIREGYDANCICEKLKSRILNASKFMDHGYFSAIILAQQLFAVNNFEFDMTKLDVLTAILLHNSLNRYDISNAHPIAVNEHPLSYLLILCDELQVWDRLAYGKVSKRDPIAWDINLEVDNKLIRAKYFFESFKIKYYDGEEEKERPNKSYDEMKKGVFVGNINKFIQPFHTLEVYCEQLEKNKKAFLYASDDNFINLCDLAKAIHASYNDHCKELTSSMIEEDFGKLPLEFKMSNIEQAKSYPQKLELINCFYSSKELDYHVVTDFKDIEAGDVSDTLGFLCREEHVRWVREKLSLGWKYGTDYKDSKERNQKKIHKDIVPYEVLLPEERSKDEVMINNIFKLLKKFDSNIKIYNYRLGRKPTLNIAGVGHRFYNDDEGELKEQVKEILIKYNKNNRVVVMTSFAYGTDQLIAECANELGIATKAILPLEYEDYIQDVKKDVEAHGIPFTEDDELKMRHLLAQTVVCKSIIDPINKYEAASQYLIDNCDVLIAIWDGKEAPLLENGNPINIGSTYDSIIKARTKDLIEKGNIHIIRCCRD